MLGTRYAPWPVFAEDEVRAVEAVLRSGKVNYWTGDITKKFEKEFAEYHGRRFGLALANGTLALELALIGFDVGVGDEVITTSRTFIASASCIVRVGAKPILADIDPVSQSLSVETLKAVLTEKTKAIVVVHVGGWPADMPAIMKFAKEHNLVVIEDCAQAHGAKVDGKLVGSFGHAAAFSFCQDKIISTGGEGGMLILDDENRYKRMWAFKDHGKSFDAVYNRQHPPGFRWLHETFGTNWRLTEMQSAIGLIQLGKLEAWVAHRQSLAKRISEQLKSVPGLIVLEPASTIYNSYYRLYVFLDFDMLKKADRNGIMQDIQSAGIPCFVGSCGEIYLEKAFLDLGYDPEVRLPVARKLAESSLAFLVHPGLSDQYVEDLVTVVKRVMRSYT